MTTRSDPLLRLAVPQREELDLPLDSPADGTGLSEPASTAVLFDRTAVNERFMGNASLFRKAGLAFRRQSEQALPQIEASLAGGDWEAARRLAHFVRGSALTVGANRLAGHCHEIEFAVHPAVHGPAWGAQARSALEGFLRESEVS